MMDAVYKKFAVGTTASSWLADNVLAAASTKEINRLEQWCDAHLNTTFQMLTHDKNVVQKFFEEVATQVRRNAPRRAARDAESWLKAVMAPMETQVREHQIQLKRRLESIKRIHQATETLEDRINELLHVESDLVAHSSGHRPSRLYGAAPA